MSRHSPRSHRSRLPVVARGALCASVALSACGEGLSGPLVRPELVDAAATQGAAFIAPQPVWTDAEDLIACPIEVRLASLVDAVVTITRVRVETRQATLTGDRVERDWLDARELTRWFDRRLGRFVTDTARLGLAGPRPFDWELDVFFEAEGRRGEVSRRVTGRCGPPIPNEGAAPVVTLVEVIGGGPGAATGDTVEVVYRVTAAGGLWSLRESTFLMAAVGVPPERTFPDGPTTVDRRSRFVLEDRGGAALDWILFVRARDLREATSLTELRIAWDAPPPGGNPGG
ncbi:MAG: hypothetical protein KA761_09160 [Gemmatimonadaceae bacterium]|jgi:hypothetical protein|nr:hypothetical protein [Gemmatimonadaceae bacterium]